jgi:hypothetical protein
MLKHVGGLPHVVHLYIIVSNFSAVVGLYIVTHFQESGNRICGFKFTNVRG